MKSIVRLLLRLLFGFRVENESSLKTAGPVLLLPNHVSWFDWLFLGSCLEKDWRFVTSNQTAQTSWVHRLIMVNRRTFPIDMNSAYAARHLAEYLQRGGRLVLFPEGRLSATGAMMKLFDGTGFLIHRTNAKVITAYLRGAQRLPFSPNPNRKRWFPCVSLHLSEALVAPKFERTGTMEARARLIAWTRDQMIKQQFEAEMKFGAPTLPEAIRSAAREAPAQRILQDITLQTLSYRRLFTGANLLAKEWRKRLSGDRPRIGLLLPNVNAMPVVMLSLWHCGKTPAILNYSTGPAVLLACARLAGLRQIVTSRAFVTHLALDLELFKAAGIDILFLEDVREAISKWSKLVASLRAFSESKRRAARWKADDTALIVFTSGSEGEPKGVELSHCNLLANIRQMLSVIDLMDTDRFFNALPLFHSFGLTVGLLLPLIQRVFVFLYPSPLHYRLIPSSFYNLNCTVFFGTNTFLAGYAKRANPYDFRSLRYLFAGAEKVQETTSDLWMRKFGVRILEGYGATECSPCLSLNVPAHSRRGSAGRFLPGIEYRLEAVERLAEDQAPDVPAKTPGSSPSGPGSTGRLFVRGPNVMRGYLNPEYNAFFQSLGGWYDTGDIARVDSAGFVFILGRLKRFAKIGGEMVSLTAVEDALISALQHYGHKFALAVLARPDEAKGERLIAITNEPKLTLTEMREALHARGLNSLAVPREIKLIQHFPLLGSGKVDHRRLETMI